MRTNNFSSLKKKKKKVIEATLARLKTKCVAEITDMNFSPTQNAQNYTQKEDK